MVRAKVGDTDFSGNMIEYVPLSILIRSQSVPKVAARNPEDWATTNEDWATTNGVRCQRFKGQLCYAAIDADSWWLKNVSVRSYLP